MPLVLHRGKDRRAGTAGFTLVELCVVVCMMGLLASLLLPALSTGREKSMRAVCQSNVHQLLFVLSEFANDNEDRLPSSADNLGYYHSIRLSDQTFTNLVELAGSTSNIFYCPNVVFGSQPSTVAQHDQRGYVIGYSYLANVVLTTTKGDDIWVSPSKITDAGTNELIADANYWSVNQSSSGFPSGMTIAPHRPMGAAMSRGSSFTTGLTPPKNTPAAKLTSVSAGIGAAGGNIGFLNMSVTWRNIKLMQTHPASSLPGAPPDGFGNW